MQKYAEKYIGATVRAANRTHGLLPPQDHGPEETVAEIVNDYNLTIRTVEGNVYTNGNFITMRFAPTVVCHTKGHDWDFNLDGTGGERCVRCGVSSASLYALD